MFVDNISERARQAMEAKGVEPKPHKWPACPVVYEIPGPAGIHWLENGVALSLEGVRLRIHKQTLYLEEELQGEPGPVLDIATWSELAARLYALGNEGGAPFAELPLQRQWEFHMTVHLALQIKHERLVATGSVLPLSAGVRYQIGERIFHHVSCMPGSFMPSLRAYPAEMVEEYCNLLEQVLSLEAQYAAKQVTQ